MIEQNFSASLIPPPPPTPPFRHIFKRLKFLGNKMASQMATMVFLAVWHGLHSGYVLCFSMEFIIVNVEKQVTVPSVTSQSGDGLFT